MTLNPGRDSIAAAAASAEQFKGLTPMLQQQVKELITASKGRVFIKSGYRPLAEQQAAHDQAAAQFGDINANRWVADPQSSNHVTGQAVDLGGDLQVASQLAPQFGLVAPMNWEPWHFEFPSTAQTSASPDAYTVPPMGEQNPTIADKSGSPAHMAASIAESLLALSHQANVITPASTGDALSDAVNVSGAQAPAATGSTDKPGAATDAAANYTPGGGAFGGVSQQKWASDFLTQLGMPVTGENLKAITAWESAESGGGGGHFNPLNTTQGGFAGESDLNSVGVKNYTSYGDGLAANVKVLNNGDYQPILDALKQGDNAMSVAQAIASTPWGTGQGVERVLGGS